MTLFLSSLIFRFRWLHAPAGLLVMLLQRSPVLRVIAQAETSLGPVADSVLKSGLVLAAMGAYNTVAGATVITPSPAAPASATVGTQFASAFTITGAHGTNATPGSWSVQLATVPPGLALTGANTNGVANAATRTVSVLGTPATAGSYDLKVTAWEGANKTGGSQTLTYRINVTAPPVTTAPAFTAHPASQIVTVGGGVTFTATVTGSPAPTLQWFKGNSALPGKTSATLSLSNVQLSDAGDYKLVATNSAAPAGVSSNIATLTVNEPPPAAPSFSTQPVSRTVNSGAAVTFTASVSGTPTPSLQWFKDGAPLDGKTSGTLALGAVTPSDAGAYTLVATNSAAPGGVPSDPATLTVNYAPVFSVSPSSQTVALGSAVTLTSAASGNPAPTFVWRKNGVILSGRTDPTLSIDPFTLADAGSYVVTAINSLATRGVSPPAATLSALVPAPAAIVDPGTLRTGSQISWDLSGASAVPAGLVFKATGLPAGLKVDPLTGQVTGVITAAAGSFKVSSWAQAGTVKSTVNIVTLTVGAFPSSLVGSYEALLHTTDTAALPAGKVALKIAANGTFTGSLLADDIKTFTLKGRLALASDNASASVTLALSRGKILPAYLLHVVASSATPALSATLSAGPAAIGASSDGARLLSVAPVGAAGPCTLLLTAPVNLGVVTEHPLGDGYATAKIAATGALSLSGKNADGTKLGGTFPLGADHAYRIYAKPYAAQAGGYVAGAVTLSARADNAARWHVAADAGSDVYWRKPDPVAATANYPDGFGPLALTVRLEPWTKLSKTTPLSPLLGLGASGDLTLALAATGLANDAADPYGLPKTLQLSPANAFSVVGDNSAALFSAKVNPATGALTGSFTLKAIPPVAKRAVACSGVILQAAPADQPGLVGGGFFLLPASTKGGPVHSGKVELSAP